MGANMISRTLAAALAAFVVSSAAAADTLSMGPPEKVGLSSQRLQVLMLALKAEVEKGHVPGAVLAIARKGQLAHFEALGELDPAARTPMPRDAIFSIGSMTKQMVSVAIMLLHDEGKLLLSDPIEKFLPQLAKMQVGIVKTDSGGKEIVDTVPATRQPTVQDLLRHTSGMTYGAPGRTAVQKLWPASSTSASFEYTRPEFIQMLSKTPLLDQPGTVWEYGFSTDVLGLLVEAVSGKSLGAFLHERVWAPLGMSDTSFTIPEGKQGRYARAFPNDPLTNRPQLVLHASGKLVKFECGGACAVSTTMDFLRFTQMLLNGGVLDGKRILSRKTVELMTADHLAPDIKARSTHPLLPAGFGFSLGFAVRTHTGLAPVAGTVGDYAWGGAFGTYFWIDPKEHLAVVFTSAAPGQIFLRNRLLVKNLVVQSIDD
jgi:CubicO group peptidase (beta-lactamase class C family)